MRSLLVGFAWSGLSQSVCSAPQLAGVGSWAVALDTVTPCCSGQLVALGEPAEG